MMKAPQVGNIEIAQSVKFDSSAILPEISFQHKSKEVIGSRATTNKSQMNQIMPQEFIGLSNYQHGK